MMRRFYCAQSIEGNSVVLQDSEAHHLAHVLRSRSGERVVVFDGSGWEFLAEVETVARHEVRLRVLSSQAISRELSVQLVLAVALPRGERQEWLTQKAVELGVTALVPLRTQRGVAVPSRKTQHRLQRTVIEASKQCGRNRLMEIRAVTQFEDLITGFEGYLRLLAHPDDMSRPLGDVLGQASDLPAADICAAVGPEGGFTDDEQQRARDTGWHLVDLGARRLRTETAALALAARLALG